MILNIYIFFNLFGLVWLFLFLLSSVSVSVLVFKWFNVRVWIRVHVCTWLFVCVCIILQLRLTVAEALGSMSHLMAHDKLEEQLPKLLPTILSLYKKNAEHYIISKVKSSFLCFIWFSIRGNVWWMLMGQPVIQTKFTYFFHFRLWMFL